MAGQDGSSAAASSSGLRCALIVASFAHQRDQPIDQLAARRAQAVVGTLTVLAAFALAVSLMNQAKRLEDADPARAAELNARAERQLETVVREYGRVPFGRGTLDEAARSAVARAVFKPYIDGGIARASAAMVPVEFSLRSSAS